MATIPAAEFKAKCLQLLDQVAETGEPLIVTKFGQPVAQLTPLPPTKPLFGALRGDVLLQADLVAPLEDEWEATR